MNEQGKTLEIQLSSLQPKLKGLLFFMPHGQTGQDVCRKFRMFHNGPKIFTSEISQLDLEVFSV